MQVANSHLFETYYNGHAARTPPSGSIQILAGSASAVQLATLVCVHACTWLFSCWSVVAAILGSEGTMYCESSVILGPELV